MNETTRESLEMMRWYWGNQVASPFAKDALVEIEEALAAPSPLSDEQWDEYFGRLYGPEGCDFKNEDEDAGPTWRCGGGTDKSYSQAILAEMDLSPDAIKQVHLIVDVLGGHCDCEILLNAAGRILP